MQRSASIQPRTSPTYKYQVSSILALLMLSLADPSAFPHAGQAGTRRRAARTSPAFARPPPTPRGCTSAQPSVCARAYLGDLYKESGQTLQGSFSAVSKPNFASTCESSRRDLHDVLLCTVLRSQFFNQKFANVFLFFPKFSYFLPELC